MPLLWVLPALITVFVCLYIRLEAVKHSADSATAQRWRDRFAPALFFGIAISLTFYTVLARVEEDIAPLYATRVERASLSGHTFLVRYPRETRADAAATAPPELVVWLESDIGAAPLTVSVELSSSSTLVFTDETGAPAPPQLTLADNGALRPQRLGMRFLEDRVGGSTIIEVLVRDATGQSASKEIAIAHETHMAFYWRVFKNRFFGDAGLGLAIASAVLGMGWQVLNERRQTRSAQQFERIREIRDLFNRDLVEWHLAAETLDQEACKDWENQARSELRKTLKDQREQLTKATAKERVARLLRDAAEYYGAKDDKRLNAVLELIRLAHPEMFRDVADQLTQPVLVTDQKNAEVALHTCAMLLRHFRMDARDLTVAVMEGLASLPEDSEGKRCLLRAIRSPGDVPGAVEMSRLAVIDPRIRRRLVDHLPWVCEWSPSIPLPGRVLRSHHVSEWLETNGLQVNPFDAEELQSHRKFGDLITLPRDQQRAIIQECTPVVGSRFDCRIAALALSNELRKPAGRCMPVLVTLSDFVPAIHGEMVHFIGRVAGEMWCAALAQQPGMLLWLPEDEQKLLVEWLVWIDASPSALRRRLRNNGLPDDVSGHIVLHRLDELLSRIPPTPPDARVMLEYLTIRPPGAEQTHLIVIDDVGGERAGQFARLMPDLQCAGIVCTLFATPTHTGGFGHSRSIGLRWSEEELLSLLDSAVAVAGGPAQRLVELVELSDPSQDEEGFVVDILKHARGSFARCLAICQRALTHHLAAHRDQNDPGYRFLNENDFIAAVFDIR